MPAPHRPSIATRRALRKLGEDIGNARRRRQLTMELLAQRAFTTRQTLQKVEAGNPMVAMGIYAAVLQALGLLDGLGNLAAPRRAAPRRARTRSGSLWPTRRCPGGCARGSGACPMADIEVHLDRPGGVQRVGTLHRQARLGGEAVAFEYHPDWLADPDRFSLEPALTLNRGAFAPGAGLAMFGSIGDSAPDTWGRRLMQRAERRRAGQEGRAVRTLAEADYLIGVADVSRLGALRFRYAGGEAFETPTAQGVPSLVELGRLMAVTDRILRDEETDADLQMIFAPGSSLGHAQPTGHLPLVTATSSVCHA